MRSLLLCAALTASVPVGAQSDSFIVDVENFVADRGISKAVMKIENRTGRDAERIYIDCVFLDKDQKAIDIGKALIPFIRSGDAAYDTARIATSEGVQFVHCSVRQFQAL